MFLTRSPLCCLCGTPWELWRRGLAIWTHSNIAWAIDSVASGHRRTDFQECKGVWYMTD